MLSREDFETPIEWVMYKINGRKPTVKENVVEVESDDVNLRNEDVELVKHTLPTGRYSLKFYHNRNGRYGVHYGKTQLCLCNKSEIVEIQSYFDENFNGKNIDEISQNLKARYNIKVYPTRGIKQKPVKAKTSRRRKKSYKQNKLAFEEKRTGRVQVRVMDKGKITTICQCYPNQKEEVSQRFNSLKKTHSLDEIKSIMKEEYNIRKVSNNVVHEIIIRNNGTVIKDGKLCTIDSKLYELVDKFIQ